MKMNAVLYYEPGVIKYEEVEVNELKTDEVLVKVKAALTCGTDIKTFKRGHPVLIKKVPSGFGHEFSGVVEKVGSDIKDFKVGDRVVAANTAPCMECYYCRLGEHSLCEDLLFLNGAYAEYIKIPARIVKYNLIKIPDEVSFEEAAFTEPLANVVHGAEKTEIKPGDTVGVVGLGPIGLLFVKVAKIMGARVIAIGRNPFKLQLAKDFGGADEIVNLSETSNPESYIRSLTREQKGLDVVIEAVGLPEIWEQVVNLTRKGGKVHFFGGCKSGTTVNFDTRRIHYDALKIISVFHHTPEYIRKALQLITDKKLDVKKLITHELSISELDEAIKLHDEGKAIKVLIRP